LLPRSKAASDANLEGWPRRRRGEFAANVSYNQLMPAIPLIIENQHDGQWYVVDLPANWAPQGGIITISVEDRPYPTRNAAQHERAKRTQARRK
jgi:hypothetical protein